MIDERRKAKRAGIPGVRVILDGADGERVEADVLDIGSGGLFIRSAKPLAVGKRMALEVQGVEGGAAWSALGRVVWTRDAGATGGPPGMGVKLIDVDEAVVAAIEVLVQAHSQPLTAAGPGAAPARERTVLGVGLSQEPPPPAGPILRAAPGRERTVLGVGAASVPMEVPAVHEAVTKETVVPQLVVQVGQAHHEAPRPAPAAEPQLPPAREASIPMDLVARKQPEVANDTTPTRDDVRSQVRDEPAVRAADLPPSEASLAAAGVPRRRGRRWLPFFLLVIALAVGGLYVLRGRIPWVQRLVAAAGRVVN
jgi:Tfp pilus assembly protein PilZ